MHRLPSLSALKAFEAVGRTGSITAAGKELAVSSTVVSRHLRNLQADLNVVLVEANGRGIILTPAGLALTRQLCQAFALIRQAVNEVNPVTRKSMTIWCTPGLASRCLLPHLPHLEAGLPGWDITLQPTVARPNFLRGEADAEIVYLDQLDLGDGLKSECLGEPRVFPVASPLFRSRFPDCRDPRDLVDLPLIHEESTDQWSRWLTQAGVAPFKSLHGVRLWHAQVAIEAARMGQGVAIANSFLVAQDLADGNLVEMVSSSVSLGAYHFIAPASRWNEMGLAAVRQWIRSLLTIDAQKASMRIE